jgi:capsular exopolysaccharide synthesis family protein
MGKILNALDAANGDVAEIIRRSLEQRRDGNSYETEPPPDAHANFSVVRTKHEAIWTRVEESDTAGRSDSATEKTWYGVRTHSIPWEVTDSAPLLAVEKNEHAIEQYRAVRTKILLSPKAPTTLVVSSPGTGDGKTLTAINLAATFAGKGEQDVLLVDADLRRPAVHSRIGMQQGPGLADVLNGKSSLEEAMLRIKQLSNLFVLPSGESLGNAGDLLDSPAWRTLVSRLRAQFRTVIYDSPPVDVFTDYDLIATACDGVILVLTPDCTDRYLAFRALEKVGGKLVGVLINRAEDWLLWKYHPSNYYYYRPRTGQKRRSK